MVIANELNHKEAVKENQRLLMLTDADENAIYRGIGVPIEQGMSVDDMIKEANLDWEVESSPIKYGSNSQYVSTLKQALYTPEGMLLNIVSDEWANKRLQFREIAEVFKTFADETGIQIERFGAIKNILTKDTIIGKEQMLKLTVFASAGLNESFTLPGDDVSTSKIILSAPFEYGKGYKCSLMAIRLVCTNGMTLPVTTKNKILSHTSTVPIEKLTEMLNASKNGWTNYEHNANILANAHFTEIEAMLVLLTEFSKIRSNAALAKLLLRKLQEGTINTDEASNQLWDHLNIDDETKIVQTCFNMFKMGTFSGSDMESAKYTAWGLLNIITEYNNHISVSSNNDKQLNSLWFGVKQTQAQSSMNTLLNYSNNRPQTVSVGI